MWRRALEWVLVVWGQGYSCEDQKNPFLHLWSECSTSPEKQTTPKETTPLFLTMFFNKCRFWTQNQCVCLDLLMVSVRDSLRQISDVLGAAPVLFYQEYNADDSLTLHLSIHSLSNTCSQSLISAYFRAHQCGVTELHSRTVFNHLFHGLQMLSSWIRGALGWWRICSNEGHAVWPDTRRTVSITHQHSLV